AGKGNRRGSSTWAAPSAGTKAVWKSLPTRVYFHASVLVVGTGSAFTCANASAAWGQLEASSNGRTLAFGSVTVVLLITRVPSPNRSLSPPAPARVPSVRS